jgi:tricorn protease
MNRKATLLACALLLSSTFLFAQERPIASEPSLSPDGTEIAFVAGGDIWTVPAAGGDARLLVSHPAVETRPFFSPDGKSLAFVSDRTGNGDIYVLSLENGLLRRLTHDDGFDGLEAWSPDGKWLYFSSTASDIAGMNDVLRVRAAGGTPMVVLGDRYTNEFFVAPAADGETLAFSARGIASAQWWRNGHSHIDESEIWLRNPDGSTRQIVGRGAKALWPMWSGDGRSLFFMSDRSGTENLWTTTLAGEAKPLTRFTSGRFLFPQIARNGRLIVFERDFTLWRYDVASGNSSPLDFRLRGASPDPGIEHVRISGDIEELALSPDGKKVAFIVRGEVFAASAKDGGDATRITRTPAAERHVSWAPDSRRLVYTSTRGKGSELFTYDVATNAETRLTTSGSTDTRPMFSPDGKRVAFLRAARELRVVDAKGGGEKLLAEAGIDFLPPLNYDRPFAWSRDGEWIAFMASGEKMFRNAHVVRSDGSAAARPVSFLSHVGNNSVSWSADGTYLLFDSGQRNDASGVARVDLIPRTPKFREDQFRDLFKEETPKSVPSPETKDQAPAQSEKKEVEPAKGPDTQKKASEVVVEGIRNRLQLLPTGLDVEYVAVSPDGKTLLLVASAAGQQNLYSWSLDELARERPVSKQITSTAGRKSYAQFSADGKEVFYLEDGRIQSVNLDNRQTKGVSVTAELDVDFPADRMEVYRQAWSWMHQHFHDPKMNGVDWEAFGDGISRKVAQARTRDEMRRILRIMIGELNASHLGLGAPGGPSDTTGRIGVRFDRLEYETNGRFKVAEIVPLSPVAVTRKVSVGDVLTAVDGVELGAGSDLALLLQYKIGREVKLTFAGLDGTKRNVQVQPVNFNTDKNLRYRGWVEQNREYVRRASGGRLGYVHMFDMTEGSLAQLQVDLDAENHRSEGVVVDIRNNNGGFVNVYALDILGRKPFLRMAFRGFPAAPARVVLGQRSLERPTVLLTNQHSLSDAEDMSEGYRKLGLGKIVGEPTSGWIIYTSNVPLIDGSILRLPFITITTAEGEPMEMRPRPVDVHVERPIGEAQAGKDSQLDRAVQLLLAK